MYEISHFPGRGLGGGKDRVHPWHFEPGTCLTEKNGPCMDCAMSGGEFCASGAVRPSLWDGESYACADPGFHPGLFSDLPTGELALGEGLVLRFPRSPRARDLGRPLAADQLTSPHLGWPLSGGRGGGKHLPGGNVFIVCGQDGFVGRIHAFKHTVPACGFGIGPRGVAHG